MQSFGNLCFKPIFATEIVLSYLRFKKQLWKRHGDGSARKTKSLFQC